MPRFALRPAALDKGRYARFAAFLKERGMLKTLEHHKLQMRSGGSAANTMIAIAQSGGTDILTPAEAENAADSPSPGVNAGSSGVATLVRTSTGQQRLMIS